MHLQANPKRRKWNENVIKNGGINIGCNPSCNAPFKFIKKSSGLQLVPVRNTPMTGDLNLNMFMDQMSFMTYQSNHSKLYESLGLPFLNQLPPSLSVVTSDPRDILTTHFGSKFFAERSNAIRTLLASPFVLVPDNFGVDNFGMYKKGAVIQLP